MTENFPRRGPAAVSNATVALVPSPDEALAMYRLTTRLVEQRLELAEQGRTDPSELARTQDVLLGTRQLLLAALRDVDDRPATPGC